MEAPKSILVYVGTYARAGAEGIFIYSLDYATGSLTPTGRNTVAENPSFLAFRPDGRSLYAVTEVAQLDGKPGGALSAFAVDPQTGGLSFLNTQLTHGAAPCHVAVDQTGQLALVANYTSGNAAVFQIEDDGRLSEATDVVQHEGSGADPRRQKGPHAHSANIDPSDRYALVCDLGVDKVYIYALDKAQGKLIPGAQPWAHTEPGAGPRHLAFHPNGKFAYVINEMGSTMSAFAWDAEKGALTHIQTESTLPQGWEGDNTGAEVRVHPNGKFLYGSNRGHDSIALFHVDSQSGRMTLVAQEPTQGKNPRNFAIDPTGRYLIAANQDGNNVVVFRVDAATGKLTPTGSSVNVSRPVCVRFPVR